MTTLYRSPNIIIDAHEWHVQVVLRSNRVLLQYRWRPLSLRNYQFLPITSWQGPRPKGLGKRFHKFRLHIELAKESERVRREAALAVRATTGAMLRNLGEPEQVAA